MDAEILCQPSQRQRTEKCPVSACQGSTEGAYAERDIFVGDAVSATGDCFDVSA